MAVQNFIEGGFYGKLGQTVGQRWRNIRIIKAYTIPHNPRTPKQQAMRGLFAEAVESSQVSMMLNQGSPIFDVEDNTSWGVRMASALARQKLGLTGFNLLPVIPKDFLPTFTANQIKLVSTIPNTSATFSLQGELPDVARNISIIYGTKQSASEEYQVSIATAVLNVGTPSTFTIADSHPEAFNSFSKFMIISNDDTATDKKTLYMSETFLSTHEPVARTFNTAINSVLRNDKTFRVVLAEPFINATTALTGVSIRAVCNGSWINENIASPVLVNESGQFAIEFTQSETNNSKIWAFPTGSTVTIGSVSAINADYILTASNVTENAFSTDLTRQFWAEIDSMLFEDDLFKIVLKQGYPSGSPSIQSVGLVVENQSVIDTSNPSGYAYSESKGGLLTLCCENPNDPSIWVAIPGSAIKAQLVEVTANGVLYTASNLNLPYTYANGSSSVWSGAQVLGNQSISQRMPLRWDMGAQFNALYAGMSTADLLARLSVVSGSNYVIYSDNVGHESDEVEGITITGAQNDGLMLSLPIGADSDFIGNRINLEVALLLHDNILNLDIDFYNDSIVSNYIWQ